MRIIVISVLLIVFVVSQTATLLSCAAQNTTQQVKVGVIVDLDRWVTKLGLSCIEMALSDLYNSSHGRRYKTRLVLHTREYSKEDVVEAASAGT